jgi:hypothetical protein
MPYISLTERNKFQAPINEVLGVLRDANDPVYVKGEYFGFFVNRVAKRFLADPNYTHNSFNSAFFNESKKKTLCNAADSIAALINRSDPVHSAGELHYALSAVYVGFLGQAEGFQEATYGLKVYLRGIMEKVLSSVDTVNTGSQKDMSMAFRRHLVIRGVLADVVESAKDAKVVPANLAVDLKNCPATAAIWNDAGKLVSVPTGTTLAVKE